MTRERFESLLSMATAHTVAVARTMVFEDLPAEVCYQMLDERGKPVGPEMKRAEFIQRVWSAGRIPEWIDLSVRARNEGFTLVDVFIASKLVEEESACVYAARGQGPFGIKSPNLPWDWESVEKSGRFSLRRKEANQPPQPMPLTRHG
jgi:hypothetical protein